MCAHVQDDPDMADWEEAAGISAPLYDIVDTLFELQSRGFFRRQVGTLMASNSALKSSKLSMDLECHSILHEKRCPCPLHLLCTHQCKS